MQQNFLLHFLWCNLSNYNVYVDTLKKQGYGEEGANLKALWELYGRAPLEAGFSGFVMAALSGAMVNTSNVFEAGKYADAEKIGEYLKGELNQNYMGETGKAAASLRADAIRCNGYRAGRRCFNNNRGHSRESKIPKLCYIAKRAEKTHDRY